MTERELPKCPGFTWLRVEHRPEGDLWSVCFNNTGNDFNPYTELGYGVNEIDVLRKAISNIDQLRASLQEQLEEVSEEQDKCLEQK